MFRSFLLAGILFATVPSAASAINQINIVKDQRAPNELELRPFLKSILVGGVTGGLSGVLHSRMLASAEGMGLFEYAFTSWLEMWARDTAANNLEIPQGYQIYTWSASWASWFAVAALNGGITHVRAGGKFFVVGVMLHMIGAGR